MNQYTILEKTLNNLNTADLRKYARTSGLLTIELMRGEVERGVLIAAILEDERKQA